MEFSHFCGNPAKSRLDISVENNNPGEWKIQLKSFSAFFHSHRMNDPCSHVCWTRKFSWFLPSCELFLIKLFSHICSLALADVCTRLEKFRCLSFNLSLNTELNQKIEIILMSVRRGPSQSCSTCVKRHFNSHSLLILSTSIFRECVYILLAFQFSRMFVSSFMTISNHYQLSDCCTNSR